MGPATGEIALDIVSVVEPTETLPMEWVAPRVLTSGISLKAYGARVERTDAAVQEAVHVVFHRIRYDPDATPRTCRACSGQDRGVKRMGRLW